MFPQAAEPKGDPRNWTEEEMRAWLDAVSIASLEAVSTTLICCRGVSSLARQQPRRSCWRESKQTCMHQGPEPALLCQKNLLVIPSADLSF